ncbi:MAG TPA: hypothetical protein DCF33_11615 [Saprospirales bacterium]|nr:hypothetical protein [Saprospirales bacterium]
MKVKAIPPYKSYVILFVTFFLLLPGCYSPQHLRTTRLTHLKDIQGLQYVVIDEEDPVNHIWLLSDVQFVSDHLVAKFEPASPEFGELIDQINSDKAYKTYKDYVFFYIAASDIPQITNQTETRLEYKLIKKTIVFEPNPGKTSFLAWGVVVGGAMLWVGVQLFTILPF